MTMRVTGTWRLIWVIRGGQRQEAMVDEFTTEDTAREEAQKKADAFSLTKKDGQGLSMNIVRPDGTQYTFAPDAVQIQKT